MTPWQYILDTAKPGPWGQPWLSTPMACLACGLDLLSFLDPTSWATAVTNWLAGPTITVNPGGDNFRPSTVVLTDGTTDLVAIEGTKSIQQWYSYVKGAGIVNWLPGRGNVFAPFNTLYQSCGPRVLSQVNPQHNIYVTGYSLGSAIGSLLCSQMQAAGFKFLQPAYLFAQPCHGDFLYRKQWLQNAYSMNHPLDPVPWLPPDALTPMGVSPWVVALGSQLCPVGSPRWPYGSSPFTYGPGPLDWIAAFGQTVASPTLNGHSSYIYGRAVTLGLSPYDLAIFAPFVALLKQLGLLDPWQS
jgi:Lipase (class 3)